MWSGSHFFSDPASLTHSQAPGLISLSRCLPTFILGEFRRGLCSTVAVQGYLDCSRSFPSQTSVPSKMLCLNAPQIQPGFPLLATWHKHSLFSSMPYVLRGGCVGSSTACIVVLDRRSHRLHTCNLGDSGFLVVRGGEVVHRSNEQQHYFNTPFQLSIAPPGAEGAVLSDRWESSFSN